MLRVQPGQFHAPTKTGDPTRRERISGETGGGQAGFWSTILLAAVAAGVPAWHHRCRLPNVAAPSEAVAHLTPAGQQGARAHSDRRVRHPAGRNQALARLGHAATRRLGIDCAYDVAELGQPALDISLRPGERAVRPIRDPARGRRPRDRYSLHPTVGRGAYLVTAAASHPGADPRRPRRILGGTPRRGRSRHAQHRREPPQLPAVVASASDQGMRDDGVQCATHPV